MTSVELKKEYRQYRVGSGLLLLFSTPFIVWQMGILFFSGTTMSLFGRTPIPLVQEDTSLVIAAGYLCSIAALCLFPRKAVLLERILMPAALAATVLMLLPFPSEIITVLFYVAAFVCVFSIGTMLSIAAQHFTVETTWRDGLLSMAVGGTLIAVLQNDFFQVSFTVFTLFSVLLVAAQTVFYYRIPVKIEAPYVSRKNPVKMPKILFFGLWLINVFSTLLLCFASSYAESVPNGITVLYLSAAATATLLWLLHKRRGIRSVRLCGALFAVAVFGFVLTLPAMRLPALRPVACLLLGFIVVLANLWTFFAAASFRVYPLRFIGAVGAGMGLALALLHSGLLALLRDDLALLYGIYASFSAALLLVYYFMEPYVTHALNKHARAGKAQHAAEASAPACFAPLSEQERILASLILAGHSETSAARQMNITLNTEKGYRRNLYAKLDIHTKRELFELVDKAQ